MGIQTYKIKLSDQEIAQLHDVVHKGTVNTRVSTRARSLLMSNEGKIDKEVYEPLGLAVSTPYDIRKRYHEGGLTRALYDLSRPGKKRILTEEQEAQVVAIACTKAPKGYAHWTLDLLTERVQNDLQVSIKRSAIGHVLLRNKQKPWLKKKCGASRT